MRSRPLLFVTASAAFLAVLWIAFRTHAANATLEARRAAAVQTRERLSNELQQAREKTASTPTSVKSEPAPVPTVPTAAKPDAAGQTKRPPGFFDVARDDPHLLNAWVANQRSYFQRLYGVLFQTLNFTPAQRERFKDILAAKVARSTDISAAAKEQGLEFDDPLLKKLADASQKQMEAELLAELGEKNFQAYQEFDRTVPVRGFVDGFAVQMAMTEPLTTAQAQHLAHALIAATPAAEPGRNLNPGNVNWPMVDRAAEQFLSPTQLAAWKLGVAHNPAGGSRLDHEFRKVYDAAVAKKKAGS